MPKGSQKGAKGYGHGSTLQSVGSTLQSKGSTLQWGDPARRAVAPHTRFGNGAGINLIRFVIRPPRAPLEIDCGNRRSLFVAIHVVGTHGTVPSLIFVVLGLAHTRSTAFAKRRLSRRTRSAYRTVRCRLEPAFAAREARLHPVEAVRAWCTETGASRGGSATCVAECPTTANRAVIQFGSAVLLSPPPFRAPVAFGRID